MIFEAVVCQYGFAAALARDADEWSIVRDQLEILIVRLLDLTLSARINCIYQNDGVTVEQLRVVCRKHAVIVILTRLANVAII